MSGLRAFAIVLALLAAQPVWGDPPPTPPEPKAVADQTLLEVRLVRPDATLERLLAWFQGTRAPHPAAALAAWKHANPRAPGLGKPREALIAALNPGMVRELKSLDAGFFRASVDPASGQVAWRGSLPRDDGSISTLAEALALTEGVCLEPIAGRAVLRIGPPGSPFAVGPPGGLAIGSDLAQLTRAIEALSKPVAASQEPPGLYAQLEPTAVRALPSIAGKRLGAALAAIGVRQLNAKVSLEDSGVAVGLDLASEPRSTPFPVVERAWLTDLPSGPNVLGIVAAAWPLGEPTVRTLFALADGVEKADPERAKVAPLRIRLNLIAAAAGLRPEVDLWPELRGLSAAVLVDDAGKPDAVILGLHTRNETSAAKIAGTVLPRMAGTPAVEAEPSGRRTLRKIEGRPLISMARGSTVWLAWGDRALAEGLDRLGKSDSLDRVLPDEARRFQRVGLFWPGRWGETAPRGSALAKALEGGPPIVWLGQDRPEGSHDRLAWNELPGMLRRWLDGLNLVPPPDRARY